MTCPNCQKANTATASFCAYCGQYLAAGQTPSPAVPPLPTAQSVPPPAAPQPAQPQPIQQQPAPYSPPVYSPPPAPYPAQPSPYPYPKCLVCGQVMAPTTRLCPRCKTPLGLLMNAEDPTGSSYVPYAMAYPMPGAPLSTTPRKPLHWSVILLIIVSIVAFSLLMVYSMVSAVGTLD